MIHSMKKKTRNGEPLYLIKFDTAEEADMLWEQLEYVVKHAEFSSEESRECYKKLFDLLKQRCIHSQYDEENAVGTMIYSSEIGNYFTDLLLLCGFFSGYVRHINKIDDILSKSNTEKRE